MGIHKKLLRVRRYHNSKSLTSGRWAHTEDEVKVFEQLYTWLTEQRLPEKYIEQCRRLFIIALKYNASFPYNDKFVKAYAECICAGDMWKHIDDSTFYNKYWKDYDTKKIQKELRALNKGGADKSGEARLLNNRLLAIQNIEKESYEKYGRILHPHHVFHKTLGMPKQLFYGLFKKNSRDLNIHSIKVSVIIPVYNAEEFIRPFLDSLTSHRSKDLEFIFIDDCGTDGSMTIIEEYCRKDPRMKVIKNETNIGPGPSRNCGIEIARGEYLAFADPDDITVLNCYEKMYRKAVNEGADVIKGEVKVFNKNGRDITAEKKHFSNSAVKERIKDGQPLYSAVMHCHQTMLYSKKLLDDKGIRYGDTRVGEDGVFLLRVFLKAKKLAFYDKTVYLYTMRPSGLSGKPTLERRLASLESLSERIDTLKEKGFSDDDYSYIAVYADFCLQSFKKHYMKHEEKGELFCYLEKFEQVINKLDDPVRILNQLPDYQYLKQAAV